jgi:eukaryotic-like serine/threonine-protein kinase
MRMAIPQTSEIQPDALLAGRYRVVDRLGSGGMATVFLAEDTVLGRRVAVKRLHAASPAESAKRFVREARLGASLNHPNIVTVFDTVSTPQGLLIVMEYVPGTALSALVARGPLDPGRAVEVLRGVAGALDHAHSKGVVHRDVKPANVLIRDDGAIKLADLGVATAAHVSHVTTATDLVGTLAYIAPERLEGDEIGGPPVDIYALAAVAFEALTGEPAQRGTTPLEVLQEASNGPPRDLRDAWEDAPPEAAEVLRRGLSPDPAERPASASELVGALESALEPLADLPPSPSPRATLATERPPTEVRVNLPRPGRIAAVAAILAATGIAAVVIGVSLTGEDRSDGGPRAESSPSAGGGGATDGQPAGDRESSGDSGGADPNGAPGGGGAVDPAAGTALNEQGYALIQQGRYEEAVPVLKRAVKSFPEGTTDINYAYALYNLGNALRLSGQPEEAIPILKQRLEIPDQIPVVQRELAAARAEAAE